jgi:hypothetical protein
VSTFLGGCGEFAKKYGLEFRCCGSCHHDFDEEYSLPLHHEEDDGYFEVCCAATVALEENSRKGSVQEEKEEGCTK